MEIDTASRVDKIRELNDRLRTTFMGGSLILTAGVQALDLPTRKRLLQAIRDFDDFSEDNNPHAERDFVSVEVSNVKYFAKIDYYAPDMEHGSEDPADPNKTRRVMTIMRANEY
jgi:Protein of unknown function (DUF3768)